MMISILNPRAWIAAVVLCFVVLCASSVGFGYWRGNVNGKATVQAKWDAEKLAQQQAIIEATQSDMQAGQAASAKYQTGKTNEAERIRIVRETVVRTVFGPCLDADGLRLANEAIGGLPADTTAR